MLKSTATNRKLSYGGPGGRAIVPPGARRLLERADGLLMDAAGETDPRERFLGSYLAALRGAGAVLACTAAQRSGREKSRNAWVLMARAAPEFAMWADYFADFSDTRAALVAGVSRSVGEQQADSFHSRVGAFLHDVEDLMGDPARLRPPAVGDLGLSAS